MSARAEGEASSKKEGAAKKKEEKPQVGPKKNAVVRRCFVVAWLQWRMVTAWVFQNLCSTISASHSAEQQHQCGHIKRYTSLHVARAASMVHASGAYLMVYAACNDVCPKQCGSGLVHADSWAVTWGPNADAAHFMIHASFNFAA